VGSSVDTILFLGVMHVSSAVWVCVSPPFGLSSGVEAVEMFGADGGGGEYIARFADRSVN